MVFPGAWLLHISDSSVEFILQHFILSIPSLVLVNMVSAHKRQRLLKFLRDSDCKADTQKHAHFLWLKFGWILIHIKQIYACLKYHISSSKHIQLILCLQ